MYALIVLWDLRRSAATLDELRRYVEEEASAAYAGLDGLLLKTWVADHRRNVWGAFYLWRSAEAAWRQPLPSRAIAIIGYPPTSAAEFEVEGTALGPDAVRLLTELTTDRPGAHG